LDDNGGTVVKRPGSAVARGGKYLNDQKSYKVRPNYDCKNIHYNADGSGRDNYIMYRTIIVL